MLELGIFGEERAQQADEELKIFKNAKPSKEPCQEEPRTGSGSGGPGVRGPSALGSPGAGVAELMLRRLREPHS